MRDDIITATFTSARGESISWGADGAHILTRLDGVSGLTVLATTNRTPGQDGESWLASRLPMRTITLIGALNYPSGRWGALRDELMRVTNPRLGPGVLSVCAHGRELRIGAYVDSAPIIDESMALPWQTYTASFVCPVPYFEDSELSTLKMQRQVGGLRFPLQLPTYFALVNVTRRYLARNDGDAECPLEMEFSGGAINPVLQNLTTGEAIKINTTIPDGHTLVINTAHGRKSAILRNDTTGEQSDATAQLDLSSVFFSLAIGDNYLSYSADEGAAGANVSARWRVRRAGI